MLSDGVMFEHLETMHQVQKEENLYYCHKYLQNTRTKDFIDIVESLADNDSKLMADVLILYLTLSLQ